MYRYRIVVRVKGIVIKTVIYADSDMHARLLAQYQYGIANITTPPQRINYGKEIE